MFIKYKTLKVPKPCSYCGVIANSIDHFIPQAYIRNLVEIMDTEWEQKLLPACQECNSTAGNKVFELVEDKRAYVHERYRKKYKKLLASPDWKEAEISEMGPNLRHTIRLYTEAKRLTEQRIAWEGNNEEGLDMDKEILKILFGLGRESRILDGETC